MAQYSAEITSNASTVQAKSRRTFGNGTDGERCVCRSGRTLFTVCLRKGYRSLKPWSSWAASYSETAAACEGAKELFSASDVEPGSILLVGSRKYFREGGDGNLTRSTITNIARRVRLLKSPANRRLCTIKKLCGVNRMLKKTSSHPVPRGNLSCGSSRMSSTSSAHGAYM